MAQEEVHPLPISRVTSILTMGNASYATRQAGKNKLQTEDMDSEEDANVKRRLQSTRLLQAQVQDRYGENTP